MNFKAATARFVGAALALTLAGSVYAQEMSVDTSNGQPGGQAVNSIDWTGDGTVDNITVWITFDPAVITPEVTGANNDVVGCLSGLPASHTGILTTCRNPAATPQRIVLVISNQSGGSATSLPTTNVGTITFNVAAGATTSTTEVVTVETQEATDSGLNDVTASVTDSNGAVNIVSGPQSVLALTPDPLDFGTVDLGNMPVVDSFTLTNSGDASANITGVALDVTTDTEYTIAADNCTGTLAAMSSCTVDIQFNAGSNGTYTGQLNVTSDANTNPNPTAGITGTADSVPNLSVTPSFGPVDLGTVVIGSSTTANGSVSNSGSADGTFSCTLSGDAPISVNPDLSGGVTVPAGGSVDFSLTCAVPDTATEGQTFTADLVCSGDLNGTHNISCGATEFVPFPIPTMSKWGLAVMALLMVMIGGLTVRFFRT